MCSSSSRRVDTHRHRVDTSTLLRGSTASRRRLPNRRSVRLPAQSYLWHLGGLWDTRHRLHMLTARGDARGEAVQQTALSSRVLGQAVATAVQIKSPAAGQRFLEPRAVIAYEARAT